MRDEPVLDRAQLDHQPPEAAMRQRPRLDRREQLWRDAVNAEAPAKINCLVVSGDCAMAMATFVGEPVAHPARPTAANTVQPIRIVSAYADEDAQRQGAVPRHADRLAVQQNFSRLADGEVVALVSIPALDPGLGSENEQPVPRRLVHVAHEVHLDPTIGRHAVMVMIVFQPEASDHECERSERAVRASTGTAAHAVGTVKVGRLARRADRAAAVVAAYAQPRRRR
jgi:hypothetical protein